MQTFLRPNVLSSRNVYPDEACAFIESLRRFITHDELARRIAEYQAPQRQTDAVKIARMREKQPLIDAFLAYDKQTRRGQRRIGSLSEQISDLCNVGMYCHVVAPTLDRRIANVHRDKLISLDGQLRPLLLEWRLASHYANTRKAHLAWFDVDHSSPEFVARTEGIEWEVECKRVSHMIAELLGDSEADELASQIIRRLKAEGLCGEVSLRVTLSFARLSKTAQASEIETLMSSIAPGNMSTAVDGLAQLTGTLRRATHIRTDVGDWQRKVQMGSAPGARGYAQAVAVDGQAEDPIALFLEGPRRPSNELIDHLWARKFEKAADQCTGERGAVLAFEWEGITDPSEFESLKAMQALILRTFDEHRNVAAILMACDPDPMRMGGTTNYAVRAYEAHSKVTKFPRVIDVAHLR
jgi:hypothetical protein